MDKELDVKDKLAKFREEREARQKARLEKLREMNLKKYTKDDSLLSIAKQSSIPVLHRQSMKPQQPVAEVKKDNVINNNRRPSTVPILKKRNDIPTESKPTHVIPPVKKPSDLKNNLTTDLQLKSKRTHINSTKIPSNSPQKVDKTKQPNSLTKLPNLRKSEVPKSLPRQSMYVNNSKEIKYSPQKFQKPQVKNSYRNDSKTNVPNKRESVFERLYKPKSNFSKDKNVNDVQKIKNDEKSNQNKVKNTGPIADKNMTAHIRRSISAVHFKRIGKAELKNCKQRWSSVGEKLDKLHVKDVNEDDGVRQEKIVSAVKSDRKKSVKFSKNIAFNLNTPKAEEMQEKLKSWLLKRGKGLDSYHHLQCFGIHHLEYERDKLKPFEDDDKENVEQPDGDDNSFTDNLNDRKDDFNSQKWRRASSISDSVDMNATAEMTTPEDAFTPGVHRLDELLAGALNDLTELLREGFEWEQCARWLRAIRERFPGVENKAVYWECRAALEERQGDLAATVECWEEAIAKGTERSIVEASLDQLMDKFMQLEISPNNNKAGGRKQVNPKLVDVKNVFVSRVIKLAVQQAKLKQTEITHKYIMTPVRRSSRLTTFEKLATPQGSMIPAAGRTPGSSRRQPLIQLCSSMRQIDEEIRNNLVFVTNKNLDFTP